MKKNLLFFILVSLSTLAHAQGVKGIFLEAGGPGGYGSINTEFGILQLKSSRLDGRIGYSTYRFKATNGTFHPDIIVPIGIGFCHTRFSRWSVGAGITVSGIYRYQGNTLKTNWSVAAYEFLSFRYVNKEHWKFAVNAYVLHEPQKINRPWAGLTFGYYF